MQIWARSRRGWVQVEMGRLALGAADVEAGARRAREVGQWEIAGWSLMFLVFADEYAGSPPATGLRHGRESLEHAERAGSPFVQATAYHALGRAHLAAGEPRAALEALEHGQALPLSGDFVPLHLAYMAEAQLGLGDGEAARATVDQAIQLAQAAGTRAWEARAHLTRARILRALDGAAARVAIEACLGRAETLVAETGARAQTPFVIEERARLAMVLGDTSGGARLLQEARRAFDATGATGHAARLASDLAVDRDG
jgi:tetratricopeptide (TPR) repeat protein